MAFNKMHLKYILIKEKQKKLKCISKLSEINLIILT